MSGSPLIGIFTRKIRDHAAIGREGNPVGLRFFRKTGLCSPNFQIWHRYLDFAPIWGEPGIICQVLQLHITLPQGLSPMLAQAGSNLSPTLIVLIAVAVFAGLVILYAISVYNNLVVKRNRYKNGFSQIDVQLKRRHDLIPNLVETVKGYMAHEKGTLEAVIAARNAAVNVTSKVAANPGDPDAMRQLAAAEGQLQAGLGRLFALAEAYPDLKANQNMANLQEELSSTENRVAFARQGFNDQVTDYNTYREGFPAVVLAGMFGFYPASLFELDNPAEREAVQVKF